MLSGWCANEQTKITISLQIKTHTKNTIHTLVNRTGVDRINAKPQIMIRPLRVELIVHQDRARIGYTITKNLEFQEKKMLFQLRQPKINQT